MSDGQEFRQDVRDWLTTNFPASLKGGHYVVHHARGEESTLTPDYHLWKERMGAKGWSTPSWPKEYGGGGLTLLQTEILEEEMARAGAFNPIGGLGIMMLGPTLLDYGTEAQKRFHIPPIVRGETVWCQGFSEPGAGSDLASLRTRCEDKGDHFLVNGQKIWTSFAHLADWCFCIVRTDTTVKQLGITFLLIDMRTPGIDVRPIRLINGVSHFCEVFFTDVRVPKENLVGEMNHGWEVAKSLLQHERSSLSSKRNIGNVDQGLPTLARQYVGLDTEGRVADGDLRMRMTKLLMRKQAYKAMLLQRNAELDADLPGSVPMPAMKNLGAGIAQELNELAVEILGQAGTGNGGDGFSADECELTSGWLYSKCFSIYGGSHEIQNNILAKRVLGLPGS